MASYGRARSNYPSVFTVTTPRIKSRQSGQVNTSFSKLFHQYDITLNGSVTPERLISFDEDTLVPIFISKDSNHDR